MLGGDLRGDAEPQAKVALVGPGLFAPVKSSENPLLFAVRHAGACVRHDEAELPALTAHPQGDVTGWRGAADGVVQKNRQGLTHPVRVREDCRDLLRNFQIHFQTLGLRLGRVGFVALQGKHIRLDPPGPHLPAAAVGAGQSQHILNEPPHPLSLPADDLGEGLLFRSFRPLHGRGGREDGGQRCPQLMGGCGDEGLLLPLALRNGP